MKVAIVDGDLSYPATSGKRLRTLNLMLRLAERHQLYYVARCDPQHDDAQSAREFLVQRGIDVQFVDDPIPAKTGTTFYLRLAANLASPLPYSVASHQSRGIHQAVNRLADRTSIDLWQCEWTGYLSALRDQPRARRLVMAHNVDSLIRQRYSEHERSAMRRWYIRRQWRKFLSFERTAFQQAARTVAVSEADATLLRREFGVSRVDVVDNGIDFEWFSAASGRRHGNRLLFLGALDWRPNLDAVRRLLDVILPRVRSQISDVELRIVGRRPPAWLVRRVAETPGVTLHADVPDVRPYLAECTLMVVPLRIGGGSRLKILESLAAGLPVVSTTVGAEGLRLVAGEHYLCADTDQMLVEMIVKSLRQLELATSMADAGRRLVRELYDWSMLADRLENVWESMTSSKVVCN
jgi:glycosyltransferase involved in cell wall biosynthesis